jgi:hypothetical protein
MFEDEVVVAETEAPVEQPVEAPKKTVPLDKYLAAKERAKAAERRLKELEKDDIDPGMFEKYHKTLGFDENVARELAKDLGARSKKEERDEIAEELDDLAGEDDFYDDAKVYEKQVRALMASGKAGDVRTAYLMSINPAERAKEIARRKDAAPDRSQPKPSAGSAVKATEALTAQDRKVLTMLQEREPNGGWNADTYRKYMKDR